MNITEFYTKRNESIINRFKQLKAERPKIRRPKILDIISNETEAAGQKLSVHTVSKIVSDNAYMPRTRKQSA